MFNDAAEVLEYVVAENVRTIDLKTVDLVGRRHHVTLPAGHLTEEALRHGVGLDTSSYLGYKRVEAGDMRVVPDLRTGMLDPFHAVPTLSFACDIVEPVSGQAYDRDPRGVARRAEQYCAQTVAPGHAVFSPELEFYLFTRAEYHSRMDSAGYAVDSTQADWHRTAPGEPSLGYAMRPHDGYHAAPPRDKLSDLRTEMMLAIEAAGVPTHYHHHEVGAPGQVEIEVGFGGLLQMADAVLEMKYRIANIAARAGLSATFMPKPMFGEAGNGMHVHQYVTDGHRSLFYDAESECVQLSGLGRSWIAGLLSHAAALLALTSPSTNSYRRLVPGYEAPISAFFGLSNRTAAVRVPAYSMNEREHRIEFRPPDATCNPYLCLAAMAMAGLDGVAQGLEPDACGFGPFEQDITHMPEEQRAAIVELPTSLSGALDALEADHDFLLAGGVFTADLLEAWIAVKRAEVADVNLRPTPHEYALYYDF